MTTPATLTIPEAARLLGIGRNLAYTHAQESGELAGVPVIRVGRRLVIPRTPLLEALGIGPINGSGPPEGEPQPELSDLPTPKPEG
jgi:hypothetical protein